MPSRGTATALRRNLPSGSARPMTFSPSCGPGKFSAPPCSYLKGSPMESPPADEARTQESVFAFLADPLAHPELQRIDTHAASVFLEGDRALKIKRAVSFP